MTHVPQPDSRSPAREPLLWFALLMAMVWVVVPALINSGQQGDHFEQFTWAHGIEWGYHKHPPLPTFLLGITIKLFGASPYWAYALAAAMVAGTAVFTFLVARQLMGERLAALTVVLWGLHWAFNWKAQLFNHNSVMMLCIAATAWLAINASRRESAWGWWAAVGIVGGLALLAKYQSAVPLVGIILALWRGGLLKQRSRLLGLSMAVVITLLVFAPHVWWVVQHDYSTLRYASTTVHQLNVLGRVARLLAFSLLHLRMLVSVLLCMGALVLWSRLKPEAGEQSAGHPKYEFTNVSDQERRAWLLGLVGWPVAVLAVLCLTEGVNLQDHWGFQAVQFISLWLAWQLRHLGRQAPQRLVMLALIAHALALVAYSRSVWDPRTLATRDRPDQFYPAQQLADVVTAEWRRVTTCPLRFVVGPTYEGGMISVYSGVNPAVLEMGLAERSPWIDLAALSAAGAVYVYSQPPAAMPGPLPLHTQSFVVPGRSTSVYDVYWTIVPPRGCDAPLPAAQHPH